MARLTPLIWAAALVAAAGPVAFGADDAPMSSEPEPVPKPT